MLRWQNLQDTDTLPTLPQPYLQQKDTSYLTQRTIDGTFNALDDPRMGSVNTRFGRNVPNEFTFPDPEPQIYTPNPRVVSRELLTRDAFAPATSLNMLAAAWIQFMTRDWFSHGSGDKNNTWQIPLPPGDDFPQNPMLIPKTIADPTRPADSTSAPPTHINQQTPWWDGSQLYPTDQQVQAGVRTGSGGKLRWSSRTAKNACRHHCSTAGPGARLVAGTRPAADAVRARAQLDLRSTGGGVSQLDRRAAIPEGAADQCGTAGENPYGGVDTGDHRASHHRATRCAATGGAPAARSSIRCCAASRTTT